MVKKIEIPETRDGDALKGALSNMSAGQLQDLARMLARAAAEAREEGTGRELKTEHRAGPRDPVVQRIAGAQLRSWLAPKELGGEGMSLRDVASMLDVTYERVRTLALKLVPDYSEIVEERRVNS